MSWYYKIAGTTQGPIERDGLVELLRKGTLTPQVEVSEGGSTWAIAPQVPGLMEEVFSKAGGDSTASAAPKPPQAPAPAPAPAPAAQSTALAGPSTPIPSESQSVPTGAEREIVQAIAADPSESSGGEAEAEAGAAGAGALVEITQPSGPVAHIVLDPDARRRAASKRDGTGFLKTATWGLIGLAGMVAAGLFTAHKVFGIDLRPAVIDQSVSKFMIESPEVVAHFDLAAIVKSKALRRTGLDSNTKIPYINDAEDVLIVSDSLDLTAPRFLAIINLKRDYRTEFVANLFRDGAASEIGAYRVHTALGGPGGMEIAACLPEPRVLLVGSPHVLRSVLERDKHPKLSPRESELIASTTAGGNSASIGLFCDSIGRMVSKAKSELGDQLDKLEKSDRKGLEDITGGAMGKIDDLDYAMSNIKHLTIEIDLGDRVVARTQAECPNPWKAKKVVRILKDLMAAAPSAAAQLRSFESTLPVANGSTIESSASFDPREFGEVFTAQLAAQGF